MEPDQISERRLETRVRTDGTIGVHLLAGGRLHSGYLYDLNASGLYVATSLQLARGTLVVLEIELPDGKPSTAIRAAVARSRPLVTRGSENLPAGLGLAFVPTSREEQFRHRLVATTALTLDLLGCASDRDSREFRSARTRSTA